jgi:hypothetical protein
MLTKVDALLRDEHVRLATDDECYFLREYTARGGFQAGDTNQLIFNLKKPPDRRGKPEWTYKEQAIERAARELRIAIGTTWLSVLTLVPMPPSKCREHPLYDDRMKRVVDIIASGTGATARELLCQRQSTDPHHSSTSTRDVQAIISNTQVDEAQVGELSSSPTFGVVDDVLTTGAHFRAAKEVLTRRFPGATVIGFFVARRQIVDDTADPF